MKTLSSLIVAAVILSALSVCVAQDVLFGKRPEFHTLPTLPASEISTDNAIGELLEAIELALEHLAPVQRNVDPLLGCPTYPCPIPDTTSFAEAEKADQEFRRCKKDIQRVREIFDRWKQK